MNALVASSITAAILLTAEGPGDHVGIDIVAKGNGLIRIGGKVQIGNLEVGENVSASGSGRFELGLDVPGGTLTFTGVGVNADSPVADDDYVITPWTIITTRNGVITAITPP